VEDVAAFEVARLGDPEALDQRLRVGLEPLRRERLAQLLRGPDVEAPLLALGVGVECRLEPALGAAHLTQRPLESLLADSAPALVAEVLPAVQVGAGQQGVVVEHLLEVRDEPLPVDRVAREAASDLVVDPTGSHPVERDLGDIVRRSREQQLERRGGRELRGPAKAAGLHVGHPPQPDRRRLESLARQGLVGGLQPRDRPELLADVCGRVADPVALRLPRLRHRLHHHPEARHPLAFGWGEVGAAVEGDAVGVEEGGQRPAPVPGHPLDRLHVDRVDVRSFLAVDLDRDEMLVHEGGGLVVLERLALHHVAPVAGRVADREQDRAVAVSGTPLRLFAPGQPVDRVLGVLEEVGTGLLGEGVGHRFEAR
jgi:hypothetical protein